MKSRANRSRTRKTPKLSTSSRTTPTDKTHHRLHTITQRSPVNHPIQHKHVRHSINYSTLASQSIVSNSSRVSSPIEARRTRISSTNTTPSEDILLRQLSSTSSLPKYILRPGDDSENEDDFDPNACPRDPLGRPLPTNYYAPLHNPYDMFKDETSTVFDPLIYGETEIAKIREIYKNTIKVLPEEHLKVRATITDPDELYAYDRIMTPLLNPTYYLEHIAHDNGKPYADTHFILDRLNTPDPEKRYLPRRFGHQNWKDFLIGDFLNGTRSMKIKSAVIYIIMFGSAGSLLYDAITGMMDYFEALEYPHHEHHHHSDTTDH